MSLSALVVLGLQACAPAGTSIPKNSFRNQDNNRNAAPVDLTGEVTDRVVLEDNQAKIVIVTGTKDADAEIKKLSDKHELNGSEMSDFRVNGIYALPIRFLDSKRMSATAVVELDENSLGVNDITDAQKKAFKFVWALDLDKRKIEIEVSKKTPKELKTLILSKVKSVVLSVSFVR